VHFIMRLPLLCCTCDCAGTTTNADEVLADFGQTGPSACAAHCESAGACGA
jgi:hypothetical protein